MMKINFLIVACLVFSLSSCITQKNTLYVDSSFRILREKAVSLDSVAVTIDYVRQSDIEKQISNNIQGLFKSSGIQNSEQSLLRVEIAQRSFLQGINPKNSLYIRMSIIDIDNEVIAMGEKSIVTSNSIVSAVLQHELIEKMFKDLFRTKSK